MKQKLYVYTLEYVATYSDGQSLRPQFTSVAVAEENAVAAIGLLRQDLIGQVAGDGTILVALQILSLQRWCVVEHVEKPLEPEVEAARRRKEG